MFPAYSAVGFRVCSAVNARPCVCLPHVYVTKNSTGVVVDSLFSLTCCLHPIKCPSLCLFSVYCLLTCVGVISLLLQREHGVRWNCGCCQCRCQ